MHDRSEWMRGETGPQEIKGKKYRNLTEYKRGCQTCGVVFSIYVTDKIAAGHADSNSFGLRNCETHRRNKAGNQDLDRLQATVDNLKQEVDPLYARNRELFEEAQVLKARLAKYELPEAMRAAANKLPWE
jgi:hypothetical protein